MRKVFMAGFWALFCLGFLNPQSSAGTEAAPVVVSIFPLADFTRQVGKERVIVKTLLPPGASPHTFEPTPRQMTELADARLFIKIGAGLEFWADRLWKAGAGRKQAVLDLSAGMPLLYGVHHHFREGQVKDSPGHREPRGEVPDPHYWLDPVLAMRMVERIARTLGEIDPAHGPQYAQNAAQYLEELNKLHREIIASVQRFKVRELVTFHSGWNYFCKRYDLKVVGVIEEAPGREPGPQDIARIVKEIRKFRIRAVFAEPQFNPKIAGAIAQEAGAKVLTLDYLGDPNSPAKDSYLKLMRYDLSQMEEVMK